jgi:SMC interacting uncharacterized protein involved in chromosome segregation
MTQPSLDLVGTWQDMIQKWEQEINSWSGKLTESEQFSAAMGQATKISLVAQRAFGEQMESLLRSMNLPSQAQVNSLAERLDAIEDSIDRLRLALEAQNAAATGETQPAAPAPRRTRKPPQEPA